MNHANLLPPRRKSREVNVGPYVIGGNNPIRVQTMTATDTADVETTVAQINALAQAGCEIMRLTVDTRKAAIALPEIRRAAKLSGMRALYMATHVNGRNLDDKSLWPVYAECEKLGLPQLPDGEFQPAMEMNAGEKWLQARVAELRSRVEEAGTAELGVHLSEHGGKVVVQYQTSSRAGPVSTQWSASTSRARIHCARLGAITSCMIGSCGSSGKVRENSRSVRRWYAYTSARPARSRASGSAIARHGFCERNGIPVQCPQSQMEGGIERLGTAGVDVLEARISHLAYAPEIAHAMLQRQQANAVIAARTRIVAGAVGMVEMALSELQKNGVVQLDEERKAQMVSNLLVVLCGERGTQPIVNTGSIY